MGKQKECQNLEKHLQNMFHKNSMPDVTQENIIVSPGARFSIFTAISNIT